MVRITLVAVGAVLAWLALAHIYTAFVYWHWYWAGEWETSSRAGVFLLALPGVWGAVMFDNFRPEKL